MEAFDVFNAAIEAFAQSVLNGVKFGGLSERKGWHHSHNDHPLKKE